MKSLKSGIVSLVKGVSSDGGQLFISVKSWDSIDYYDVQSGVTWPTDAAEGIGRLVFSGLANVATCTKSQSVEKMTTQMSFKSKRL